MADNKRFNTVDAGEIDAETFEIDGEEVTFKTNNPTGAGIGLFAGGYDGSSVTTSTDKIEIQTLGNSISFGDLTEAKTEIAGCGNSTDAFVVGRTNVIEKKTFASNANATNIGSLTNADEGSSCASNSTKAWVATKTGASDYRNLETFDLSTGISSNLGTLFGTTRWFGTACASPTRANFFAGLASGNIPNNVIQRVLMSNNSISTSSVSLPSAAFYIASGSNSTDALIMGGLISGSPSSNVSKYTDGTDSISNSFATLSSAKQQGAIATDQTRAVYSGRGNLPYINTMDYFEFASGGAASDFGDLTVTRGQHAGCSDSHGGL